MTRILLDTDIGTDVDDACALALCLQSPEIELLGISIVSGDVETRGQIALRMLEAAGRRDVPVALGAREPILGPSRFGWFGYEGKGVLERFPGRLAPASVPAWQLLGERILAHPGAVTLVPIGPLTNVALALKWFPEIRGALREIVMMGGNARVGPEAWKTPVWEYNVGSDPEASRIVFESGVPITMVGLDVTLQVQIGRGLIPKLRENGKPLGRMVADQLEIYLDTHRRDQTFMHDPLAVALLLDRTLCRTERMQVSIETRGEFTRGMTVCTAPPGDAKGNADVCVTVDAAGFEEFLSRRLLGE